MTNSTDFTVTTHSRIWLKTHPSLDESWVQGQIADDPAILGLGPLMLVDKERRQPSGGRPDLLLQDEDASRRYEVEIQLGRTDESHLIRTIEYWDIERKRYPQYDHCAVIVAEDVTTRFLNVIGLFNGHIPLIAIQMSLLRIEDKASLVFMKVVDEVLLGEDDATTGTEPLADRSFWEQKVGSGPMSIVDGVLALAQDLDETTSIRYAKTRLVLWTAKRKRIAILSPQKRGLRVALPMPESDNIDNVIDKSPFDRDYFARRQRYRLVLGPGDVDAASDTLRTLLAAVLEQDRE